MRRGVKFDIETNNVHLNFSHHTHRHRHHRVGLGLSNLLTPSVTFVSMSNTPPPPYGFNPSPYAPSSSAPQYPPQYVPPSAPWSSNPSPYATVTSNTTTTSYPCTGPGNVYPQRTTTTTTTFEPITGPRWVNWQSGQPMPYCAVHGGIDMDGSDIYVGRIHHGGDLIPAKVIPLKNVAYICYNGQEIAYSHCEILCHSNYSWNSTSYGNVPGRAISAGRTSSGETLYVGRVHYNGATTVGKVHPSHRVCYIPFNGKEMSFSSYEVLVA